MKSGQCWRTTTTGLEAMWIMGVGLIVLFVGPCAGAATNSTNENEFPEGFFLGAATAAYQIEGNWDKDGKGENIWDYLLHTQPNFTEDGSNADVAVDSYHRYQEDIDAVSAVGSNMYRISISWSRILPTGYANTINKAGIDYYNKVIDSILAKDIVPLVTIYHFDLPQELQKLGGWTNPAIVPNFVDYARVLFENFGDRVKWWATFNEPSIFSKGYSSLGLQAPSVDAPGIADYLISYSVIKAHAQVWHMYNEEFRPKQNGKVGMALNCEWQHPKTDSEEDVKAAERVLQFKIGLWAHPIFSKEGNYPKVVRERVDKNSKDEGRTRSRLPYLTPEEVSYIRGSADFFGFTHYSTYQVTNETTGGIPSLTHDMGGTMSSIDGYPLVDASSSAKVVPWGLRQQLNWLAKSYPGYPFMILENGCSDSGTLEDHQRIAYLGCYMSEVLRAIHEDGVDVKGYLVWSIVDNFEWQSGYTVKYGLYHVDRDDPHLQRKPKASVSFVKRIYESRTVPLEYFEANKTDVNSICYTARNGETSSRLLHNSHGASRHVTHRHGSGPRRSQHPGGHKRQRTQVPQHKQLRP